VERFERGRASQGRESFEGTRTSMGEGQVDPGFQQVAVSSKSVV
jgi:hypothetical protein